MPTVLKFGPRPWDETDFGDVFRCYHQTLCHWALLRRTTRGLHPANEEDCSDLYQQAIID